MEPYERLRAVRKELGMSQGELAKKIKMAVSSISAAETGNNAITSRILFPLKILYKVNDAWIIKGTGDMFLTKVHEGVIPEGILEDAFRTKEYIYSLQSKIKELESERDRFLKIIDKIT